MTSPDREEAENGEAERVVVRDRRRIDPVTGKVRTPADAPAGETGEQKQTDSAAEEEPPISTEDGASADLAAEVAERTADLQRVTAEYANYRRRVDRDREQARVAARVQFVSELLTVLDDIERADAHGDLTGPFKSVADKLGAVMQKLGLDSFGLEGEPFDPAVHEAVQHEESAGSGPVSTVINTVLRRGYRMGEYVLRPAMVTVVDRVEEPVAGGNSGGNGGGRHALKDTDE